MNINDYASWKAQAQKQGLKIVEHLTDRNGNPGNLSVAKDKDGNLIGEFLFGDNVQTRGGFLNSNSFQNGVAKAEQEIMNKANSVGVKLKNAMSFTLKTGQAVSDMASNELGKLLTYKEGELLAARVREGAWSDEDVKKHILRSNYKKWEEPKFRSSSFGLMEQQRMRSMLK